MIQHVISAATLTNIENLAAWVVVVLTAAVVLGGIAALVNFSSGCASARVYRVKTPIARRGVVIRYTPRWTNREAFGQAWDAVHRAPREGRRA